ncbi:TetR/AcrR family transcriptional regulator [Actinokineospora sp.]|uniref:TetR/AcrR family transcriptional regulator n=1 Tax=Actinokineospora sp. TaxID=1872133 RepID=UPI004037D4BD
MPRPRSQSRRQILDSARVLLCRQGYQGTGLAQIVERSGAPRGSLYFLFPGGKEQVAVEAVTESAAEFDGLITAAFAATDSPGEWVQAVARQLATSLESSDYREGCPITTITLDSVPDSAPLTAACRATYDTWLASITRGLTAYGVPGDDAAGLAMFILSSVEGAMALCRAYQSTVPLAEAERHVLILLRPYLTATPR